MDIISKDYLDKIIEQDKYVVSIEVKNDGQTALTDDRFELDTWYKRYLKYGGKIEVWHDGHLEQTFRYKPEL